MKPGIHPEYETAKITCACGRVTETRSTVGEIHVEICSHCHPFFTGRQKLVDTAGRVERFMAKYGGRGTPPSEEDEAPAADADDAPPAAADEAPAAEAEETPEAVAPEAPADEEVPRAEADEAPTAEADAAPQTEGDGETEEEPAAAES